MQKQYSSLGEKEKDFVTKADVCIFDNNQNTLHKLKNFNPQLQKLKFGKTTNLKSLRGRDDILLLQLRGNSCGKRA